MTRIIALLLCALLSAPAAANQNAAAAAEEAAEKLIEAGFALSDAKKARDRVSALTQTIKAYEGGLAAMRDGLRKASVREQVLQAEFDDKAGEISQLLGVLQSMGSAPTPLLMLHPTGPVGTARSGMILADITPGLQSEVDDIRLKLQELTLLRDLQQQSVNQLREALLGVQEARTELSKAISERTELPKRFVEDPVKTAILLDSSETLASFAVGLSQIPLEGSETQPSFDAEKGALTLPVAGVYLRRFQAPDAAGIKRPGILLASEPLALVTAPAASTVRYSGPLLDYGNVAILEPATDTLIVLAGLGQIYVQTGEVVPKGAPIGLMGNVQAQNNTNSPAEPQDTGNTRSETLYIEIREGSTPVDPELWFAIN